MALFSGHGVVNMEIPQELVCSVSNGTISNDLE